MKELKQLLVKADSAMQNEEWVKAYEGIGRIMKNKENAGKVVSQAIRARVLMRTKNYKAAHQIILDLLRETYPANDPLRK